jgi:cobalt-zinc-cadmium efflux system protein
MWLDPVVSLIIVATIVWGTWSLLRGSIEMSLNAVPEGVDADRVRTFLLGLPGVSEIHDLHIWPMSTTETALTAHLVTPAGFPGDAFLVDVQAELREHHGIGHATLQIETGEVACSLAPAEVV